MQCQDVLLRKFALLECQAFYWNSLWSWVLCSFALCGNAKPLSWFLIDILSIKKALKVRA